MRITELRAWVPTEHLSALLLGIARSVIEAHRHAPDRWGLRATNSLMLKVGRHEVMQIGPWQTPYQLIVLGALVPDKLRSTPGVSFSGSKDWKGNPNAVGYYVSHPGTEACRFGFSHAGRLLPALADAHSAVIAQAAQTPRHPTTAKTHARAFIDLLSRETGLAVPQPSYSSRTPRPPRAALRSPGTSAPSSQPRRTSKATGGACWWLGVNNSRGRSSRTGGHVHHPEIEPFLSGDEATFVWRAGGAPGSSKLYAQVRVGDGIVLWMGDGVHKNWGVIGFAEVREVQRDGQSNVAALVLARPSRGSTRTDVLTPYPKGCPARTANTDYLRELFGPSFRPLRKMYVRLGYRDVKPCVVTIERVPVEAHGLLLARLRRAGVADDDPASLRSAEPTILYSGDKQTGPPVQWSLSLDAEAYAAGLMAIEHRVSPLQRRLLVSHYGAPRRTIHATDLARLAEVPGGYRVVNLQYGRLGRIFAEAGAHRLDQRKNGEERLWSVWSRGLPTRKGFIWEMLPAVASALEELGWVDPLNASAADAAERPDGSPPGEATSKVAYMTRSSIHEAFDRLEYQRDVRRPPDERRRGRFRAGWDDAAIRGRIYSDRRLERLTWQNLGNRLGRHFGEQAPEAIDAGFDILAALYEVQRLPEAEVFPILARLIMQAGAEHPGELVAHDSLVSAFLEDAEGATIIERARATASFPSDTAAAAEIIAWFSQQVSGRTSQWSQLFETEDRDGVRASRPVPSARADALSAADYRALEGEPRLFFHTRRERDPKIVGAKRDAARNSAGELVCEACGFIAGALYDDLAADLCEVHHRRPLGDAVAEVETRLEDLAILCPTCHRAIHQTRPMRSVEDFRDRYHRKGAAG